MNQQEPDPIRVLESIDSMARACGWVDRHHMKQSVLKARRLTPEQFRTSHSSFNVTLRSALRAKYQSRLS